MNLFIIDCEFLLMTSSAPNQPTKNPRPHHEMADPEMTDHESHNEIHDDEIHNHETVHHEVNDHHIAKGYDVKVSILLGLLYGVVAQLVARLGFARDVFIVMSFSYVIILPFCLGFLSIASATTEQRQKILSVIIRPILLVLLCMLISLIVGWEGTICVAMAIPIYIPLAVAGGFVAKLYYKNKTTLYAILSIPIVLAPLETDYIPLPKEIRTVHTSITLSASAQDIWPHIIRVKPITEPQSGFFYKMGFPKPVEATLSHEGVGGVREAKFEGGLTFFETIVEWVPLQKIRFTIQAHPNTVPITTLDPHVVPGGAFFEALEGCYEIQPHPHDPTKIILHLSSRYRLSTHFNIYASWWGDWLMKDIQDNILQVIYQRVQQHKI